MTVITPNELVVEVMAVELLRPDPHNPRDTLGEFSELTDSIESIGVLQPLIVTPTGEIGDDDAEIMMVVAGHRRLAAAMLAERTHVPVIVRVDITEEGRRAAQFIENFHRLDLGPIERARALRQLADTGMHQKDIGAKVGINQGTVSKWLSLLKLPENAQKWVAEGRLVQEDAVALAALPEDRVAELTGLRPPAEWEIRKAKDDVANAKRREAATKKATEAGWTILEKDPGLSPHLQLELGESADGPVALDLDRHDPYGLLPHVDPDEHANERCHAVFIARDGDLRPACTDSARHPKPQAWKSPAQLEEEREQSEIEAEAAESLRSGKPVAVPRGSNHNDYQVRLAKVGLVLEPVLGLVRFAIEAAPDADGFVLDFVVRTALDSSDVMLGDPAVAADLLCLEKEPNSGRHWAVDAIEKEFSNPGGFTSLHILYALALTTGLADLREVLLPATYDKSIEPDEDTVDRANAFLAHLDQMAAPVPSLEDLVATLTAPPVEEAKSEGEELAPTVEVYEKRGKFLRWCSDCGDLDGVNTKVELANDRALAHLRDVHHLELAEAGVV